MKREKVPPQLKSYSEAFKIKIVREYEEGNATKDGIMRKYSLGGHSLVLEWCRKYGKLYYPKQQTLGRRMKDPQKQRIKELENELKKTKDRLIVYEKLIEITKRESGIDILKNTATKLSENWQSKEKE